MKALDPSIRGTALVDALEKSELVALKRRFRRADRIDGYLVGLGKKWAIVQRFHTDSAPLGYSAIRVEDIAGVRPYSGEDFLSRACSALRYRAAPSAGVDLDSDAAFVVSLGESYPLVTIYNEDDDPSICFVGAVSGASRGRLRLRELSPSAVWDESDTSRSLREVTRVDVDGPYERALDAITRRHR